MSKEKPVIDWSDYFIYDPETGSLTWKARSGDTPSVKRWNKLMAGKEVGGLGDGGRYLITTLKHEGVTYHLKVHRICYEMENGPIPEGYEVDHKNHIKVDNRACNFEIKLHKDNMKNMSKQHNNTSGQPGVHFNKASGTWLARIGKQKKYLGSFHTYEEAVAARKQAELEGGYHENHGQ